MGCLECCDCLIARDRGEVVQEFVEAVAALQVVDQVAQGAARADEDGCSAENFRMAVHDRISIFAGGFHLFGILAYASHPSYRKILHLR